MQGISTEGAKVLIVPAVAVCALAAWKLIDIIIWLATPLVKMMGVGTCLLVLLLVVGCAPPGHQSFGARAALGDVSIFEDGNGNKWLVTYHGSSDLYRIRPVTGEMVEKKLKAGEEPPRKEEF